jgi:hypothetical protein
MVLSKFDCIACHRLAGDRHCREAETIARPVGPRPAMLEAHFTRRQVFERWPELLDQVGSSLRLRPRPHRGLGARTAIGTGRASDFCKYQAKSPQAVEPAGILWDVVAGVGFESTTFRL